MKPTPVLQQAAERVFPAQVSLLLAGHVHLAEVLDFGGVRPPQVVVGNGGTRLVAPVPARLESMQVAGVQVQAGNSTSTAF